MDTADKQKVPKKSGFFKTLKSWPHAALERFTRRNPSAEDLELEKGDFTPQHYNEKDKYWREKTDQLFRRLQLKTKADQKLKLSDILQINAQSLDYQGTCEDGKVVQVFMQRLLLTDYRVRNMEEAERKLYHIQSKDDSFEDFMSLKSVSLHEKTQKDPVHPMDVQMAVFHCSDSFLKQLIVTKLSQCQYALPLLVPNPFTRDIEFPMWTFRQITKSWNGTKSSCKSSSTTKPMYEAETPMVAFFRLGSISSSKSQLINDLINEKHNTFFHRNCPGSSRERLLMEGVVEIAWYLPSGKDTDHFSECVAFCNLHGDSESHEKQLEILTELSSVNLVVLGDQGGNSTGNKILKKLYQEPKPLVFLFCEDDSAPSRGGNMKFRLGLKGRNKSEISKDLRTIITQCLSESITFSLENLCSRKIIKDEDDEECRKGKELATRMMMFLRGNEPKSKIKEKCLPCQGELWQKWCQEKKELHRLHGPNIEMQKCNKQTEMKKIREQQHEQGRSPFMELFIDTLRSLTTNEKCYFLKWLGILLDNSTTDELCNLRITYNTIWSQFLDLKEQADKSEQMKDLQTQLEEISRNLSAAAFGMEHIFREMGQIYESFISVQTGELDDFLPELAAKAVLLGFPLELMDGDTGHVPLDWVSAVLDELIKKLGNQKVFVLSVLGIQSSGKSTMLNAMFGLQFAVSAGRCTRGAFMQLVKVSEEMKEELKFDYVLVVDTEGLQALEPLEMSTRQHDNGLATFVVGLGNMTLINIFGENPVEMQDMLQIVVQAFMRMKKVRLNPSCVFVHQNVGEVTAGEKNMEGRRRLLEKLDAMTKLAAKEEHFNAKCFSDVIAFDVRKDVWYFAQLWEGNPPMAPPNPSYCENVQELKQSIISKMSKSRGMTLSELKGNFSNLWNALLDENFVFSFRNTLEIAVYRKLELEYSKWTWRLRSEMLNIENKLHNRVTNDNSENIDEKHIAEQMKETKTDVEKLIKIFFNEERDKEILIQWKERFERKISELCNELVEGTKRKLDEVIRLKKAREKVDREKKAYENKLFTLSKEFAFCLKNKETDHALDDEFEGVWLKWVTELTWDTPSVGEIDIWGDVTHILSESFELNLVCDRQTQGIYKRIDVLQDYSDYVLNNEEEQGQSTTEPVEQDDSMNDLVFQSVTKVEKHVLSDKSRTDTFTEDISSLSVLIRNVAQELNAEIEKKPIAERGYSRTYIAEIITTVKNKTSDHWSKTSKHTLKKEFTVDLCLHVCNSAMDTFAEMHNKFKEAYDVRMYLERQRTQYFNIFKNYCNGANSAAVFGRFIVDKLEPSILQAAHDQSAIDLSEKMKCDVPAFSGNRSNLEKHILTSLAEEENFENYIEYIKKPREYFNHFINKKVHDYIHKENSSVVVDTFRSNIISKGKRVMDAVNEATEEAREQNGDVGAWLQVLSRKLQDELQFKKNSCPEQNDVTDLDFLGTIVSKGLNDLVPELSNSIQDVSDINWGKIRKKPEEILSEHLCRCCWAQCPFCNSICTNTLEDHSGDHSVRFHRNLGVNGWSFMFKKGLGIDFCTTLVSSNLHFREDDKVLCFKDYRKAGEEYARWNINPDNSEMPYWKWFVCRFQEDLEKHYKKKFTNQGEIPAEWRNYSKENAIESLNEL